jgi:DNA-binding NarL/FixJ family response regulator
MTLRILIADDEPLVRTGLRAILDMEDDLTVVGEATSGAQVLPLVRQLRPDLVLMDVRMPDVDGIQATRYLVENVPEPPRILVITTFENDEYVYDALRAGATGFLLKRTPPEDILAAVRLVATGDSLLFPTAIRNLAVRHASRRGDGPTHALTEREADVLRLIAQGLSNVEIASRLYITPQTVKTHVSKVLAKLGARDRTQAVIIAYESGFVGDGFPGSAAPSSRS